MGNIWKSITHLDPGDAQVTEMEMDWKTLYMIELMQPSATCPFCHRDIGPIDDEHDVDRCMERRAIWLEKWWGKKRSTRDG